MPVADILSGGFEGYIQGENAKRRRVEKEEAAQLQKLHVLKLLADMEEDAGRRAAQKRLLTASEAPNEFAPTIERGFAAGTENLSAIVGRALEGEKRRKGELEQAFSAAQKRGMPVDREVFFGSSPEEVAKQEDERAERARKQKIANIDQAIEIYERAGNLNAIKPLLRRRAVLDPQGTKSLRGELIPEEKEGKIAAAERELGEELTPEERRRVILGARPEEKEGNVEVSGEKFQKALFDAKVQLAKGRSTFGDEVKPGDISDDEAFNLAIKMLRPSGIFVPKPGAKPDTTKFGPPAAGGAVNPVPGAPSGIDPEIVDTIKRGHKSYNAAKEVYKAQRASGEITEDEFQLLLRHADAAFPRNK